MLCFTFHAGFVARRTIFIFLSRSYLAILKLNYYLPAYS